MRVIATSSRPQTASLANLRPGETRTIRLEFTMYNPGSVTSPVCDVVSLDLTW